VNLCNDLQPCPFCGTAPYTLLSVIRGVANDGIKYRLRCGECGIEMAGSIVSGDDVDELEAVINKVNDTWNNRANCMESKKSKDNNKKGFWKPAGYTREYRWYTCSDCSRTICDTTDDGMEYEFCPYCGKPKSNPNG
jgi:hypothetical protein